VIEETRDDLAESLEALTLPSPQELMAGEFRRTAIIGVGLIGGSIGLRMKAMEYAGEIIGHDTAEALGEALTRGAIDRGAGDLTEAISDADLIVLAAPGDQITGMLPTALRVAKDGAVVTDTGCLKFPQAKAADECRDARAAFLGGHPLAGGNRLGIVNADDRLFENSYWLLTPTEKTPPTVKESLAWWVRLLGAYPLMLEPELHDRIMAMTSHVPFVIALALSRWIAEHSEGIPILPRLATGNFQTMSSAAGLPLTLWEADIRGNRAELEKSLGQFIEVLQRTLGDLRGEKLPEIWQQAHQFQRRLSRDRPGDWDANCELVVTVPDRPGTIARIASLLAAHEINIRDIHMLHVRERRGGTMAVVFESRADARAAMEILTTNGYGVRLRG